jgi:hypothetical protein
MVVDFISISDDALELGVFCDRVDILQIIS